LKGLSITALISNLNLEPSEAEVPRLKSYGQGGCLSAGALYLRQIHEELVVANSEKRVSEHYLGLMVVDEEIPNCLQQISQTDEGSLVDFDRKGGKHAEESVKLDEVEVRLLAGQAAFHDQLVQASEVDWRAVGRDPRRKALQKNHYHVLKLLHLLTGLLDIAALALHCPEAHILAFQAFAFTSLQCGHFEALTILFALQLLNQVSHLLGELFLLLKLIQRVGRPHSADLSGCGFAPLNKSQSESEGDGQSH